MREAGDEPNGDPQGPPDVSELSVFPNPAKDLLTIALPERVAEDKAIYLYDTFGKMHVSSKIPEGNWKVSMELKGLPSGMYLVKVGYGDYGVVKKVMVVE